MFIGFFFLSSRRRHTISKRDWSSDVCSSDLVTEFTSLGAVSSSSSSLLSIDEWWETQQEMFDIFKAESRSEERRVGKECRYQCVTYECKKKIHITILI